MNLDRSQLLRVLKCMIDAAIERMMGAAIENMIDAATDPGLSDGQVLALLQEARENCITAFGSSADERFRKIIYKQLAVMYANMQSSITYTPATSCCIEV